MSILYNIGDSLYINATNKCPCSCTFCIRKNGDNVVGAKESMWLGHDPSADEIIGEFAAWDLSKYKEIVFCGYGEPLCALDAVLKTADWIKKNTSLPVRLNTNGLSDLINEKPTAPMLEGRFDCVSISLNAPDAERFSEVTRSRFGIESFDAMLSFAAECKKYVPEVVFTVVDVITPDEIEKCEKIADEMGIPLRVRKYIENYTD